MNLRVVARQLGMLLLIQSLALLGVTAWSGYDLMAGYRHEMGAMQGLAVALVICALLGLALRLIGRGAAEDYLGRREALLLVGISWLIGAAMCALPYWIWALRFADAGHPFRSLIDCYFEAMSGLTTTGATVLSQIQDNPATDVLEGIPRGLLLWRSTTHWLGGLGIVVLFVAVLPNLGVGGKKLFGFESPGPAAPGVRPRIRQTARVLWLIYLGLTIIETVALRLCGMTWFEAVNHTFATLATGGFSTRNASVGAVDYGLASHIVIIFFMVLAGTNFGLFYQLFQRRFKQVLTDPELRLYLLILFVAALLVSGSIAGKAITETNGAQVGPSTADALHHGVFQTVSIQTTTGFCTADFDLWGFLPKAILLALMFVGASAGSTGGGIKVIRILIAAKVMFAEIERVFRPNVVRSVKVGKQEVPPEMRTATLVYVLGIPLIFLIGAIAIMVIEQTNPHLQSQSQSMHFITAATASAATLNNIGPGLDLVGAMENYGWFHPASKVIMSLLMVLGRLEVYAVLVLFLPRFWRSE